MNHSDHPTPNGSFEQQALALRRLARHLVKEDEVEDLVQDAWVAAVEKGWSKSLAQPAWMRGVVRKQALQRRRSGGRRVAREQQVARSEGVVGDGKDLGWDGARDLLLRELALLPETERQVLKLHYLEELSVEATAQEVRVPRDTVKGRLQRGLRRLRERLDEEFEGGRAVWALALVPMLERSSLTTGGLESEEARGPGPLQAGLLRYAAGLLFVVVAGGVALRLGLSKNGDVVADLESSEQPASSSAQGAQKPQNESLGAEPSAPVLAPVTTTGEADKGIVTTRTLRVLSPDGEPLSGAEIWVDTQRQDVVTDDLGELTIVVPETRSSSWSLAVLPDRTVLQARHAQFLPSERWHVSWESLAPGALELSFTQARQAVRGRVVSTERQPLAGAKVGLFDGNRTLLELGQGIYASSVEERALADAEGAFEIRGLCAPGWIFRATVPGYVPLVRPAVECIAPDGTIRLPLLPAVHLSGTVLDETGRPVSGARLSYTSGGGQSLHEGFADGEGRFVLDSLPAQGVLVWAEDPSDSERYTSAPFFAYPLDRLQWDFRIARHTPLRVRLTCPEGFPAAGLLCQLQRDGWAATMPVEGAAHVATFPRVPEGPLDVLVLDPQANHSSTLAVADSALPTDGELRVSVGAESMHPGSIRGRLLGTDGEPIRGPVRLSIAHRGRRWGENCKRYDPSTGDFLFEGQVADAYSLDAALPYLGNTELTAFQLAPGETLDLGVLSLPESVPVECSFELPDELQGDHAGWTYSLEEIRRVGGLPQYGQLGEYRVESSTVSLRLLPGSYRLRTWEGYRPRGEAVLDVSLGGQHELFVGLDESLALPHMDGAPR